MAFDGFVGWSKKGATIESIEGRDELRMLEQLDEGDVVWVSVESIEERVRLRCRYGLIKRKLSGGSGRKKGKEAEWYARP